MKSWLRGFAVAVFLVLAAHAGADPVVRVEAVGMTVSDMDRAIDFYGRVLSFQKISDFEVADESFERLQGDFGATAHRARHGGRLPPSPGAPRAERVHRAPVSSQRESHCRGYRGVLLQGPDGRPLEILAFPPDKVDPKWHRLTRGRDLVLGIDHTVIVVDDTERSLGFYRDRLGYGLRASPRITGRSRSD